MSKRFGLFAALLPAVWGWSWGSFARRRPAEGDA